MYTSYYMNGNLKIPNIQSNALSTIKYMVIDIDGTLTDGGIYYDEQGNEFKKFNTKDAAGFFTAKACGIFTVVITGRRCQATERRMKEMQVDLLEQGIYTKEIFFERSTALEDKIKDFDKKIESVNADIVRLDLSKKNRSTFVPKCQELLNAWDTFDAADKNTALKNVIERIDFTKTEKNARGQRHSSFFIDVFPRISR